MAQDINHPNRAQGFEALGGYATGDMDAVNMFTGSLNIAIPIGQSYPSGPSLSMGLTLVYSSLPWAYSGDGAGEPYAGNITVPAYGGGTNPPNQFPTACPGCSTHNAGAGWRLNFGGQLFPPTDPPLNEEGDQFLLIEPDGTRRLFFESLHPDETFECDHHNLTTGDCDDGTYYTRDNSYLRAHIKGDSTAMQCAEVVSPSGVERRYDQAGRLHSVVDRFGNTIRVLNVHDDRKYIPPTVDHCATPSDLVTAPPNLCPAGACTILQDQYGRDITLQFYNQSEGEIWRRGMVRMVTLPAFGSQTLYVHFLYSSGTYHIPRSQPVTQATVPLLTDLLFSTSSDPLDTAAVLSSYAFTYNEDVGIIPGALETFHTPLGATTSYEYTYWSPGNGTGDLDILRLVEGVSTRTISNGTPARDEVWQYLPGFHTQGARVVKNVVRSPDCHERDYYFALDHDGDLTDWRHGLPFDPTQAVDGSGNLYVPPPLEPGPGGEVDPEDPNPLLDPEATFLSMEVKDGLTTSSGSCETSPVTVQRTYVRYTGDLPDTSDDDSVGNRRLMRTLVDHLETTVKPDATTVLSSFDGLGHYRTVTLDGSSLVTNGNQRTVTTAFNGSQGYNTDLEVSETAAGGTFTEISPSTAWILGTFDLVTISGDQGTFKRELCFDANTGVLDGMRTRADAATRRSFDFVHLFDYDASGYLDTESFYGGDRSETASVGTGAAAACAVQNNAIPDYEMHHVYSSGALRRSEYLEADGESVVVGGKVYNTDIDADTGLPNLVRDISEVKSVSYDYDAMSRVVAIQPTDDAWTQISYEGFDGSPFPKVTSKVFANGQTSGALLQRSAAVYDHRGRVYKQRQLDAVGGNLVQAFDYQKQFTGPPGGYCSAPPGAAILASEWVKSENAIQNSTELYAYDPFGRPRTVFPPDDVNHRVNYTYEGFIRTIATSRLATSEGNPGCPAPGDENCVDREQWFDRLGRLRRVVEPSLPGGGDTQTFYQYNALGQLTSVSTTAGGTTQDRTFTYDGRGVLAEEQHPEKGISGNGWSSYCYDAGGNVYRTIEGRGSALSFHWCSHDGEQPFDLLTDYDRAGRPLQIAESASGSGSVMAGRVLKSFHYGAGGSNRGKLIKAVRHNYVDLDGVPGDEDVTVTEEYSNTGDGGRVDLVKTAVTLPNETRRFRLGYAYDDLGDVTSVDYPCEASATECLPSSEALPAPTIGYTYSRGWLTDVAGWTNGIDYYDGSTGHDNGSLKSITFANDSVFAQGLDPHGLLRPAWQTFAESSPVPTTGPAMTYDGQGNLKTVGSSVFRYDSVSRLRAFKLEEAADPTCEGPPDGFVGFGLPEADKETHQAYKYDAFGNLLDIMRCGYSGAAYTAHIPGINSATNRFTGGTYDAAGNLLSNPSSMTYQWDRLSVLQRIPALGETYIYTADDERLLTMGRNGVDRLWRLRGLGGEVLREWREDTATASGCSGSLEISNQTLFGSFTYTRCAITSSSTEVAGDITFAANEVHLGSGFKVLNGATFHVRAPEPPPLDTAEIKYYVYGAGRLLGSESSTSSGTTRTYMGSNWLGTPVQISDASTPTRILGNQLFGYGERVAGVESGKGDLESELLFTGHERDFRSSGHPLDWDLDLDYMHARYYSPMWGRFLSVDPVGGGPGEGQSWNRYAYVMGRPTSYIDPSGFFGEGVAPTAVFACYLSGLCGDVLHVLENASGPRRNPFGDSINEISWFTGFLSDLPLPPAPLVDLTAALGDQLLFGFGDEIRSGLGIDGGIDRCSASYTAGSILGLVVPGGVRLGYAFGARAAASAGARIGGEEGARLAFALRGKLKILGRFGFLRNVGRRTFEGQLAHSGSYEGVIASAGRTNLLVNNFGLLQFLGSAANLGIGTADCN